MLTALLSVCDKRGIAEYAAQLHNRGGKILASSGTAKVIAAAGVPVQDITTIVGPPILNHRVVTLSREIHAGLLAQRNDQDRAELTRLGIDFIDVVYVTLYPLLEELRNPEATIDSITEKTDIGGPAMLRSAAKGRRFVITNEDDARIVLAHLDKHNGVPVEDEQLLRRLAFTAERAVAKYTLASAAALTMDWQCRFVLCKAYGKMTGADLQILGNV